MKKEIAILATGIIIGMSTYAQTKSNFTSVNPMASTEGWTYLAASADGNTKYYIKDGALVSGTYGSTYKEQWIKGIDKVYETAKGVKYYNTVSMTIYSIDCPRKRLGVSEYLVYNSKGSVIISANATEFGGIEYNSVVPESVGESFYEAICNK